MSDFDVPDELLHGLPSRSFRGDGDRSASTVFVKGLPEEFTDEQLVALFERFGPIRKGFIVTEKGTGQKSKGFGYVVFALQADAENAIQEMNGSSIGDQQKYTLEVSEAKGKKKDEKEKKIAKSAGAEGFVFENSVILVKNVPKDVDSKKLYKKLKRFGGSSTKVILPAPESSDSCICGKLWL
jgi:RNA recognition motif-containing protein